MKKTQLHYLSYLIKSISYVLIVNILSHFNFFIGSFTGNPIAIKHLEALFSSTLFCVLLCIWGARVYQRVISKKIQTYVVMSVFLMVTWFILRAVKYSTSNAMLSKYIWYLYYLPMIFLPLISLYSAIELGNNDKKPLIIKHHIIDIIGILLFIMVMTNDLHGFVFKILVYEKHREEYIHMPGYYIIALWMFVVFATAFILIIKESRIKLRQFYFLWPLALLTNIIFYSIVYVYMEARYDRAPILNLTEVFCWFFTAIWEFLITAGLIPTNRGYISFFNQSSLSAYITDKDGNVVYESENARVLSPEDFELLKVKKKIEDTGTGEDYINELSEGYVVYNNNMTDIYELIEELEDVREELRGEKYIKEKANEAEAAKIRIEEKEYLFEKLTGAVISQMSRIKKNLELISKTDGEEEKELWKEVVILGTFVKRYSNLLLLKEGDISISIIELKLSIMQSMENLKLVGVNTGILFPDEKYYFDIEKILQCYELFENIIEWDLKGLKSIHVMFSINGNNSRLLVESECEKGFDEFEFYEYAGTISIEKKAKSISALLTF